MLKHTESLLYQYAIDLNSTRQNWFFEQKLNNDICDRKCMLTKNRALGKFPKRKICVAMNTLEYQVSLTFLKPHFYNNTDFFYDVEDQTYNHKAYTN
jgi:hypothetical protein